MEDIVYKTMKGEIPWKNFVFIILVVWGTQIVTWLLKFYFIKIINCCKPNMHDFNVYEKYKQIFSQNILNIIKNHNFGDVFEISVFEPIINILCESKLNPPEYSFHDKKLEKKRNKMNETLNEFICKISIETFSNERNINYFSVPYKKDDPLDENRQKIIKKLNDLASKAFDNMQNMNEACLIKFDQKINKSN